MAAKKKKRPAKASSGSNRSSPAPRRSSTTVYRFAHPFYDLTPANTSSARPADAAPIAAFTQEKLEPIPKPVRSPPEMNLRDIIGNAGSDAVQKSGKIIFHAFGDSGNPATDTQELVSDAMTAEYDTTKPETCPSFLLHLGDVIYFDNTDAGYLAQFYAPYKRYPGKIIAIPGNHDGELFKYDGSPTGQKVTLGAFQENFCHYPSSVPPAAGTIYRQMVSQPGVYWRLAAPFVDVVGLYSNIGETSGFISSPALGTAQKDWLITALQAIKKDRATKPRKALILAVHHPLYSGGGHEPSIDMQKDLDDACQKGGLMPDVVLTAHAHNYQRFTRRINFGGRALEIPYIVAGTAGRGIQPVKQPAKGQPHADASFDKSLNGYGFLRVTVATGAQGAAATVKLDFTQVEPTAQHTFTTIAFDSATVNLATAKVT